MATPTRAPHDADAPSVLEEVDRTLARMSGRDREGVPSLDESIDTLLKAARSARRSSRDDDEPCRLASHLDKLESGISNLRDLLAARD